MFRFGGLDAESQPAGLARHAREPVLQQPALLSFARLRHDRSLFTASGPGHDGRGLWALSVPRIRWNSELQDDHNSGSAEDRGVQHGHGGKVAFGAGGSQDRYGELALAA